MLATKQIDSPINPEDKPHNSRRASSFDYVPATEFPRLALSDLGSSAGSGVYLEPPGELRQFHRQVPAFLDDPDGVGLFSPFEDDTLTGGPNFIATARNVRQAGFRTILTGDGLFFNDEAPIGPDERQEFLEEFALPDPLNEETGLRRVSENGRFEFDEAGRSYQRVEGTTIQLSSLEPSNYGSWIFRVLPKMQLLAQTNLMREARFLVWASIPTFREYLYLLGIREEQIVDHYPDRVIYELEHVLVPSNRNSHAFLDPVSLAFFGELRAKYGRNRQPGMKVYVSRLRQSNSGSCRILLNERELIEKLTAAGFIIAEPERLPVPEQIALFSSAELVVGPSGSGMFNTVYCHKDTKVIDIESEPHWIHAHRSLFGSCGLNYGIFVGSTEDRDFSTHHKPWRVNIDALLSRIHRFCKD